MPRKAVAFRAGRRWAHDHPRGRDVSAARLLRVAAMSLSVQYGCDQCAQQPACTMAGWDGGEGLDAVRWTQDSCESTTAVPACDHPL